MKHKLSVSVDEETIVKIQEKIRNRTFRNKSHAVEYALMKILEMER